MINYICESPVIALLDPIAQKDRLDTFYYHPLFKDLDERLAAHGKELVCIDDIAEFVTDGTHYTPTYVDDGVLFLSATNIKEEGLSLEKVKYIPKSLHDSYSNCQPIVGDVMVAKNGKTGVACVFPKGIPECSIYVSIALIRLKKEWLPDFVSLAINSELGFLQIQRNQKGIGVKNLHLEDIRQIQVPCLKTHEQEKIVSRYNAFLAQKRNTTARLEESTSKFRILIYNSIDKQFASELGLDSFTKPECTKIFLRKNSLAERLDISANHPDYAKLIAQIKNSPNSGLLSDLVEVTEEQFNPDEQVGDEVNYLAIGDIDGIAGKIIVPQTILAEELPSRARRLIHEGDILVGIAGASTGTENMVVFPVSNEQEGWVATTGFLVLQPKSGVDIHYVCTLLKSPFILRQIRALLTSPAMPTISESDFLELAVPVTNEEIRTNTLLEINNILSRGRQLAKQQEAISRQIQGLLSEAKSDIFNLLDDEKFSAMPANFERIDHAMAKIEEELQ